MMRNKYTALLMLLLLPSAALAAQQTVDKSTSLPANFTHGQYRTQVDDNWTKINANFTELYNGAGAPVSSVFGRTGAVTAQQGDYSSFYMALLSCSIGQIPKVNSSGNWACGDDTGGGGGSSTFLGLTDTPASYTANYYLRVNSAGTAIEMVAGTSGGGDVTKVGTPVDNQVAIWTGDGTVEGDTGVTWDGSTFSVTGDVSATNYLISAADGSIYQRVANTNGYTGMALTASDEGAFQWNESTNHMDLWDGVDWNQYFILSDQVGSLVQAHDTDLDTAAGADAAGNGECFGKDSSGTVGFFTPSGGGGSSLYVAMPPTYSDEACTPGSYAFDANYIYDCVASGDWNRIATTDWNNPTPATYTLNLGVTGQGTITIGGTDYTATSSPHAITGLSGSMAMTAAYGTGEDTLAWSGTDSAGVTGTYPNYSITMDANKTVSADFSASGGTSAACSSCGTYNGCADADIICEDYDTSLGATWTTTGGTNGTIGPLSHSGTWNCTDKGSYALDVHQGTTIEDLWKSFDMGVTSEGYAHFSYKMVNVGDLGGFDYQDFFAVNNNANFNFASFKLQWRQSSNPQLYLTMYTNTYVPVALMNATVGTKYEIGVYWLDSATTDADIIRVYVDGNLVTEQTGINLGHNTRYILVGSRHQNTTATNTQFQIDNLKVDMNAMPSDCSN